MKKYFFLLMVCLASVGVMAQHNNPQHHDHHPAPTTQQHHDQHHHDQHHDQHHHNQQPAPKPVICATHEQMTMVLQVLDKQSYDDKRMEVAQLCVMLGHFCTRDLARMCGRFTMEDNKVKFLIFAHKYCEDPQNYYTFRDVLRFKSDYDRLMDTVEPHHPHHSY